MWPKIKFSSLPLLGYSANKHKIRMPSYPILCYFDGWIEVTINKYVDLYKMNVKDS